MQCNRKAGASHLSRPNRRQGPGLRQGPGGRSALRAHWHACQGERHVTGLWAAPWEGCKHTKASWPVMQAATLSRLDAPESGRAACSFVVCMKWMWMCHNGPLRDDQPSSRGMRVHLAGQTAAWLRSDSWCHHVQANKAKPPASKPQRFPWQ